jgi:hypothetical protein
MKQSAIVFTKSSFTNLLLGKINFKQIILFPKIAKLCARWSFSPFIHNNVGYNDEHPTCSIFYLIMVCYYLLNQTPYYIPRSRKDYNIDTFLKSPPQNFKATIKRSSLAEVKQFIKKDKELDAKLASEPKPNDLAETKDIIKK